MTFQETLYSLYNFSGGGWLDFESYEEKMKKALNAVEYQVCSHGPEKLCSTDLDIIVPISNIIVERYQS